jgi:hypothetical protein
VITARMSKPMTAAITYLMLKFFMMDGKWGANDVAEGVDYPRTAAGFLTRNMTFRLKIFTVVLCTRRNFFACPSSVSSYHTSTDF